MLKNELIKLQKIMENKIEFYIEHKLEIKEILKDYERLNSIIIHL